MRVEYSYELKKGKMSPRATQGRMGHRRFNRLANTAGCNKPMLLDLDKVRATAVKAEASVSLEKSTGTILTRVTHS